MSVDMSWMGAARSGGLSVSAISGISPAFFFAYQVNDQRTQNLTPHSRCDEMCLDQGVVSFTACHTKQVYTS